MADGVQFKLEGVDSLVGKLRAISYDVRYKGGRAALRAAARVVVKAAKENAAQIDDPESAESIAKNIVERWDRDLFKKTKDLGFRVGVLGGASEKSKAAGPGGKTFHWRFIEFGTSRIKAVPFMRPALSNNIAEATNTFVVVYEKAIDRAIKRAKKAAVN